MKKYFLLLVSALFLANPAKAVELTVPDGDALYGELGVSVAVVMVEDFECTQDLELGIPVRDNSKEGSVTLNPETEDVTVSDPDKFVAAMTYGVVGSCSVSNNSLNDYTIGDDTLLGTMGVYLTDSNGEPATGLYFTNLVPYHFSDKEMRIGGTLHVGANLKQDLYKGTVMIAYIRE